MAIILQSDVKACDIAMLTQLFVTEYKPTHLSNIAKNKNLSKL